MIRRLTLALSLVTTLSLPLATPGFAQARPGAVVSAAPLGGAQSVGGLTPARLLAEDSAHDGREARRAAPSFSSVPVIDIGGGGHGGSSGGDTAPAPAGGSYQGPGDTVSGGGSSGPRGSAPSGGAPSGGHTGSKTNSGPGTSYGGKSGASSGGSAMPNPVTLTTTQDDTWWLWWEFNKNDYLRPNRLSLARMATTGDDPENTIRLAIAAARDGAVPLFAKSLADADANVRGAAVVALGRTGGAASIPALLRMLDDANQDVRHQAILALGATGAQESIEPLLAIARTGAVDGDDRRRISPFARPIAIVALGLGRRHQLDDRIDVEIMKLVQDRTRSNREEIGVAALIYTMLAPSEELERYALAMAKDDTEAPSVRCRAIESLRHATSDAALAELRTFVTEGRMDLRRSAALALGDVKNPAALSVLTAAYEKETEPLTRGFLLISIGRRGGESAQAYLKSVLEKGESGMRRWAALALGIEVRKLTDVDQVARLAACIREAREREKGQEGLGAYSIAMGLARDTAARPLLRAQLETAADPRMRMYAASAMALLGGDEDAAFLRSRLAVETLPVARVAIADALGVLGHTQDVPRMAEVLTKLNEPALQGLAASAMASHGTREALLSISELARVENGSPVRRSAAVAGLGMILSPNPPLTFAEVSRGANYTVFSEWVSGIFVTTL